MRTFLFFKSVNKVNLFYFNITHTFFTLPFIKKADFLIAQQPKAICMIWKDICLGCLDLTHGCRYIDR